MLEYWETPVPSAVWITIILVVCLILNIIAVEVFGEAEFWFASIKLITIIGLIIVGIVIMAGGAPRGGAIGFHYWNDPGAFKEYVGTGATGRFTAYWTAFVRAGFSFITSPELIGLAAGETVSPRRNIPKAARRFRRSNSSCLCPISVASGAVESTMLPSDSRRTLIRRKITEIGGQSSA